MAVAVSTAWLPDAVATPAPAPALLAAVDPYPNWQLDYLRAEEAWQHSRGAGVTVAVIDNNIDPNHPDIAGQVVDTIYLNRAEQTVDPQSHGTAVAAMIVGTGDLRTSGLAPDARILAIGAGTDINDPAILIEGIYWAVDNGADVINISSVNPAPNPQEQGAIRYAFDNDVVVVAATANTSTNFAQGNAGYPAAYPGVIAVGATTIDGVICPCTPASDRMILTAPGEGIAFAYPGANGVERFTADGSSMAAPLVAATAALLRAQHPEMNADNVVNRLIATPQDAGPPGWDPTYGFGIVDPVAALTSTVPIDVAPGNPLIPEESPGATPGPDSTTPQPPAEPSPTPAPTNNGGGQSRDNNDNTALIWAVGGGTLLLLTILTAIIVMLIILKSRPSRPHPPTPPTWRPPPGPTP